MGEFCFYKQWIFPKRHPKIRTFTSKVLPVCKKVLCNSLSPQTHPKEKYFPGRPCNTSLHVPSQTLIHNYGALLANNAQTCMHYIQCLHVQHGANVCTVLHVYLFCYFTTTLKPIAVRRTKDLLFAIGGGEIKLSRRKLLSFHKEPLVTLSSNWSSDEELYVKGKLEQGGHMNVQIDQCVMSRHWTLCLNSVFA